MSIPAHWLHIYQRPAQGNQFIVRKQAFSYQHQKLAVGGDDTMDCDVMVKPIEGELALENWVGCRVAVFVDNPWEPVWEGLITRVYYSAGLLTISRSIDEMFNQVETTYQPSGSTFPGHSTTHNETDSQAIYGVKSGLVEGFATQSNPTAQMDAIRDLVLTQVAWPLTTVTQAASDVGVMRIEAKGFYHTLKWDKFFINSSVTAVIKTHITNVLSNLANGNTFINNTDVSDVQANTAYQVDESSRTGKTVWQMLQAVQGGGDGSAYWVMGISRTNPLTGTRRFYYRPARTDVYYTARTQDGLRPRTVYGGLVRPWLVEPDRTIRVQDILTGWSGRGIDPRETYIESIRYIADKQQVTWAGADDLHMQGALQLHRYYKMIDTTFGAVPRQSWT